MQKKITPVIALALSLVLLVSCTNNHDFDDFTMLLFQSQASSDRLTLHYTIKDPDNYGISAPACAAALGRMPQDPDAVCASIENTLAALRRFDRNTLSADQRLTYDILKEYFETSLALRKCYYFAEPLSPLTGVPSQLPLLFSEYSFYDEDDISDYFELLSDLPAYFDSLITFEKEKAAQGLFMSREQCDRIISECRSFIKMGSEHYLFSSFEERLQALPKALSSSKAEQYIAQNNDYVNNIVFYSYNKLINALTTLRTYASDTVGLCHIPGGRQYYERLVSSETGSDRPLHKLASLICTWMKEDAEAMKIYKGSFEMPVFEDSNPLSILATLKNRMDNNFPALPDCNIEIKYVPSALSDYMSPAFYMIPPIDASFDNVIYINAPLVSDDLSLFTTLAHEGYPGHLYQTVYFSGTSPEPVRLILNFGGYTEGWATYCEMMSFYCAPISKAEASMYQHNASLILGAYAYADLGIHYFGWSFDDFSVYFRQYGVSDTSVLHEIYLAIISNPANYLKYYVGYVEFLELKKEAIRVWGDDFSQNRFHTEILNIGPAPFSIIENLLFR